MTNHETISPAGGDNITTQGGDVKNSLSFALPLRGSVADRATNPPDDKNFVLVERPKDSLSAPRVLRAPVCAAPKQTSRSGHQKSATAAATTTTVATTAPGGEEAEKAKWDRLRRALEAYNSDHLVAESLGYVVVDGDIIGVW